MSRLIHDDALRTWEVFASTGDYGAADPARIVFRCTTEPGVRPRAVRLDGDKSEAEKAVIDLSDDELGKLFQSAKEIG